MKYGKQYEDALAQKNFEKWREGALRYKTLKKVISRLTDELASIGLDAAVLRELLDESDNLNSDLGLSRAGEEAVGGHRSVRINGTTVKARAEYQLDGTSDHPTPRIKLVFDSTSSESESETNEHLLEKLHLRAPVREDTSDLSSNNESFTRFEEVSECEASTSHPLVDKLYGVGVLPADDVSPPGSPSDITPTSRLSRKSRSSATLVRIPGKQREVELHDIDLPDAVLSPVPARLLDVPTVACTADESSTDDGDFADDEEARAKSPSATLTPSSPKRKKRRRHSRVIYIPLKSDTEFYTLLARALQSLQDLEEKQKVVFAQQVEELSRIVSKVASPSNSKGDMYNWREIFSLWVEAQIFESAREKDRGERSLQQAEERLDWFVDQVGRRKLATKMKSKESRQALEEFLDLNITLLDLKRFIRMNEEAARKILKKHDKRTALTATSNFPQFLHHLNAPTAGEAGALTKYDLSLPDSLTLPHVLLATMTQTLLPIIPQIDDYTCVICGDVSYKPIRLDCGHYFCLRCLVKMQKRKQDACPQCRAPVVLKADGHNLDVALEQFLEKYFPKEVKEKARSNERESTRERWEAATQQVMADKQSDKCTIA